MHFATQQNICAANKDTSQHSKTPVQPIRSDKIKQYRRVRLRSEALVFRAAPASIVEYRLKNCFPWSASSMPPLGFQCLTPGINLLHEHSGYANFTLQNEQNRRQGDVHRPGTGNPVLPMLMRPDGNYNHANLFRNGRGRNKSVASTMQPIVSVKGHSLPKKTSRERLDHHIERLNCEWTLRVVPKGQ
jgi:hypothetical protein